MSGFSGTVDTVSTRSTRVETFDGQHVSMPNGEIFQSPVKVMTRSPNRRSDFPITVAPGSEPAKAIQAARQTVENITAVHHNPAPDAGLKAINQAGNLIEVRFWTSVGDAIATRREALLKVNHALEAAGGYLARWRYPYDLPETQTDAG